MLQSNNKLNTLNIDISNIRFENKSQQNTRYQHNFAKDVEKFFKLKKNIKNIDKDKKFKFSSWAILFI